MSKDQKIILEIKNLKKSYGETKALRRVDLQFKAGTVHTIFGENGSGKSTMVKIVSGIVPPDGGEILFHSKNVRKFNPRFIQMLGIVPVLQEILIAPNCTVLDNIFLGYEGIFKRLIPAAKRYIKASDILEKITRTKIDLDAVAGSLPLSQKQLVVIARALLHKPKVLILDEATSGLDIEDREILFQEIHNLVEAGCLIIYISHRLDEVLKISDNVTVFSNGENVCTIPRDELTADSVLRGVQGIA